ncbi:MAG: hypothetical protein R6V49_08995 [Bacteroidales bacterium]
MKFYPEELDREVEKFKELTNEATFLVRALFFLIFGFLIETREILNLETLLWAIPIVMLIYLFRIIQLKLSRLPLRPLLFMAPRGLITILLFLSIDPGQQITQVNQSLVIQIVLLTAIVMTVGLMTSRRDEKSLMESVQQVVTAMDPEDEALPEEVSNPDA